jgi:hypothetical protein
VESLKGVPSTISNSALTAVTAGLELRRERDLGMPTAAGAKAEAEATMAARRIQAVFICAAKRITNE